MKRIQLYILLVLIIVFPVCGGDIAAFVNLGFSPDSGHFMFAQYGLKDVDSSPYADLFIIDVKTNLFVPYGQKSVVYEQRIEPGNNVFGALLNIIEQNIALKTKYSINHLVTGRILYHLIDGAESTGDGKSVSFRDFNTGTKYAVTLHQSASGKDKAVESTFHLEVIVIKESGVSKTFTVGHPAYKRKGVRKYQIKQIILAPDEASLIFIMEKEEVSDNDSINIRYMVETLRTGF